MKHLNIKVTGRVQGVGFRFFTTDIASDLGVNGFVRNEADGSVYIEAEGNENQLEEFLERCEKGPAFSKVKEVKYEEDDLKNYQHFDIQR